MCLVVLIAIALTLPTTQTNIIMPLTLTPNPTNTTPLDGNTTEDAGSNQATAMLLAQPGTYNGSLNQTDMFDCFNITAQGPGDTIYVSIDFQNPQQMGYWGLGLLSPSGELVVEAYCAPLLGVYTRVGLVYTLEEGDPVNENWTISVYAYCTYVVNYWLRFNVSAPVSMSKSEAEWTFMAYLDGDCNLGDMAMTVLAAMAEVGSTDNVNIVALLDHSQYSYTRQSGTRAYYVFNEGIAWLQDFGDNELNMGDPATLENFMGYVKQHFPAERYALNLWNHGNGVLGVCIDESDNDNLEYDEIFQALNSTGGVDVLFYFSCLTACLENFYTIANVTKVAVASEELMAASGDYYVFYADFLQNLINSPGADATQLGTWIVNAYDQRYPWPIKTMAAVNTTKMAELYVALNETAKLLDIQTLNQTWINGILQTLEQVEKYPPENSPYPELVDLYDFMDKLVQNINDPRLQPLASSVKGIIESAVIAGAFGDLHESSHGIGIYHPTNAVAIYGYYFVMNFSMKTMWDEYLLHFFKSQYHQVLDYDSDGLTNAQEYQLGTDAFSSDSDRDGMPDGWEVQYGLDPLSDDAGQDKDGDGLTSIQEYQRGTNPASANTDGDGMPDGWEVQYGLDPLSDDAGQDKDGDGFTNLEEYRAGTDPTNSSSTPSVPSEGLSPSSVALLLLVLQSQAQQSATVNLVVGVVGGIVVGVLVGAVLIRRLM
ncbi:MAG: clostripain-related cysteine peptidase [Candidatus Jordarchaeales archaeon]